MITKLQFVYQLAVKLPAAVVPIIIGHVGKYSYHKERGVEKCFACTDNVLVILSSSRNIDQRMTKSSQGKVLCKARSFDHDDVDTSFDLAFDVSSTIA